MVVLCTFLNQLSMAKQLWFLPDCVSTCGSSQIVLVLVVPPQIVLVLVVPPQIVLVLVVPPRLC